MDLGVMSNDDWKLFFFKIDILICYSYEIFLFKTMISILI